MATLQIIPAGARHAAAIVQFNAAMAIETENRPLNQEVLSTGVAAVLRDPSLGQYWMAEMDERPIGQLMITYEWSDWRNCMFWWIQSVYVVPEHRGKGIYRALHDHVASSARRAGNVGGVRLYVDKHNERAQAVYRSIGMHETNYAMFEMDWSSQPARPVP